MDVAGSLANQFQNQFPPHTWAGRALRQLTRMAASAFASRVYAQGSVTLNGTAAVETTVSESLNGRLVIVSRATLPTSPGDVGFAYATVVADGAFDTTSSHASDNGTVNYIIV